MFPFTSRWKVAQYWELKWWQSYFRKKHKNDYYQWKGQYWRAVLDKGGFSGLQRKGLEILDAGCGPAGIFTVLDGHQVDAMDPLMNAYETQLPLFDKHEYPWVRFYEASLEDFNASHQSYDVIFCMNAINHVADIKVATQHLADLLKDNGILWITVDAHNYQLFKQLFRLIPGDVLHPHQYDLSEYKSLVHNKVGHISEVIPLKHEFFFDHYLIIAQKKVD